MAVTTEKFRFFRRRKNKRINTSLKEVDPIEENTCKKEILKILSNRQNSKRISTYNIEFLNRIR